MELEKKHQATIYYDGKLYTFMPTCFTHELAKKEAETYLEDNKVRQDLIEINKICVVIVDVYVPIFN